MLILDDEFLQASQMSEEQIKLEFGIWLYEGDKISLRKAAKMVGLNWLDFSEILCERNIPTVKMTNEELEVEMITVNSLI